VDNSVKVLCALGGLLENGAQNFAVPPPVSACVRVALGGTYFCTRVRWVFPSAPCPCSGSSGLKAAKGRAGVPLAGCLGGFRWTSQGRLLRDDLWCGGSVQRPFGLLRRLFLLARAGRDSRWSRGRRARTRCFPWVSGSCRLRGGVLELCQDDRTWDRRLGLRSFRFVIARGSKDCLGKPARCVGAFDGLFWVRARPQGQGAGSE
jgi:hypothetical protein